MFSLIFAEPISPTTANLPSPPAPFGSGAIRRTLKKQSSGQRDRPRDRPPSPPTVPGVGMIKSGSFDEQLSKQMHHRHQQQLQQSPQSESVSSPEHVVDSPSQQSLDYSQNEAASVRNGTKDLMAFVCYFEWILILIAIFLSLFRFNNVRN